jgi:hypothetical protein
MPDDQDGSIEVGGILWVFDPVQDGLEARSPRRGSGAILEATLAYTMADLRTRTNEHMRERDL